MNIALKRLAHPLFDNIVMEILILESNPKIKIIAQTAYANFDEKEKALIMGCVDYISKTIKEDNLVKIVQKNL